MHRIEIADSDEALLACYEVMSQLRPEIAAEDFVERIRQQQAEGYRLAALWHEARPVAVAGYRLQTNLYAGKQLYVDDLVTLPAMRSNGFGAILLTWLRKTAKAETCAQLHLDSGLQRTDAHRFYKDQGMEIVGYHFRIEV